MPQIDIERYTQPFWLSYSLPDRYVPRSSTERLAEEIGLAAKKKASSVTRSTTQPKKQKDLQKTTKPEKPPKPAYRNPGHSIGETDDLLQMYGIAQPPKAVAPEEEDIEARINSPRYRGMDIAEARTKARDEALAEYDQAQQAVTDYRRRRGLAARMQYERQKRLSAKELRDIMSGEFVPSFADDPKQELMSSRALGLVKQDVKEGREELQQLSSEDLDRLQKKQKAAETIRNQEDVPRYSEIPEMEGVGAFAPFGGAGIPPEAKKLLGSLDAEKKARLTGEGDVMVPGQILERASKAEAENKAVWRQGFKLPSKTQISSMRERLASPVDQGHLDRALKLAGNGRPKALFKIMSSPHFNDMFPDLQNVEQTNQKQQMEAFIKSLKARNPQEQADFERSKREPEKAYSDDAIHSIVKSPAAWARKSANPALAERELRAIIEETGAGMPNPFSKTSIVFSVSKLPKKARQRFVQWAKKHAPEALEE